MAVLAALLCFFLLASAAMALAAKVIMPPIVELAQAVLDIIENWERQDEFPGKAGVPVQGSHALSENEVFLKGMEMGENKEAAYKGRAHTLFSLCCDAHAMRNVPVSMHDVNRYREEYFAKLSTMELPKWRHPITFAVTADTVGVIQEKAPGAPVVNLFRKISMDIQIYAFCWSSTNA